MDRHVNDEPVGRTVASLEDARDLRAAIDAALGTTPVDQRRLRGAIFTYVGTERDAGVSPGLVILALTERVGSAKPAPPGDQPALLRNVILWCVEAYFGQLGGDPLGQGAGREVAAVG